MKIYVYKKYSCSAIIVANNKDEADAKLKNSYDRENFVYEFYGEFDLKEVIKIAWNNIGEELEID